MQRKLFATRPISSKRWSKMVPNIQVESNVLTVDEVERVQRRVASKKQGNESKNLLGKTIQSLQVEQGEMKSKYKKLDDLYRYTRDRDRK